MTDKQILEVLNGANDATPWVRVVRQLIDTAATEATAHALQPNLTSEARHYNSGGAARMHDFKQDFEDRWQQSRTTKDEA